MACKKFNAKFSFMKKITDTFTTVEPLVYAIEGAEKNSHISGFYKTRISEKSVLRLFNNQGPKISRIHWQFLQDSHKRIYERFDCS
jgi:hypothetical protein